MPGPLPPVPSNFLVQSGNGQVYLNWNRAVGSSGYYVLRSTDSINYSQLTSTSSLFYYDSDVSPGTQYSYEIQSWNGNGNGLTTDPVSITCLNYGQSSLGSIRLAAQQRADQVNSNFVTTQEWNSYINHSYNELYDIMVQAYGQEYFAASTAFLTDGRNPALYPLPDRLYKLMGVDLGIAPLNNYFLTLKNFQFISRNRFLYGTPPISFLGFNDIRYRMIGNQIQFIPTPQASQTIRIWYVPRPATLLADSDLLEAISGWDEYVIVDAAIKAMQKEESDVTVLVLQKEALRKRIEAAANNRDIGMPEMVSNVRGLDGGPNNSPMGDGPIGGF